MSICRDEFERLNGEVGPLSRQRSGLTEAQTDPGLLRRVRGIVTIRE